MKGKFFYFFYVRAVGDGRVLGGELGDPAFCDGRRDQVALVEHED
jgi:hypothetical protein